MNILDRFFKYISIDTTSNPEVMSNPSTKEQLELAKVLYQELKDLNIEVSFDEVHCYLYAKIKGNDSLPKIGFIAHIDTSKDAPGKNIKPRIIPNYDGKSILLNDGKVLSADMYKDLENHVGKSIIVTDGNTLLGADDKAGIAEIMQMAEHFSKSKDEFGDIFICFTPDEEIGLGTMNLDFEKFHPDFAYTIDGSSVGEFSYENFNAASASITIKGNSCHAGSAKGVMINAVRIAAIINSLLPDEIPENTEGYEGFYFLEKINGDLSFATMKYAIRDFDKDNFAKRKEILEHIVAKLNAEYGSVISLEIKDTYKNMKEIITKYPEVIQNTMAAIKSVNIVPNVVEIRGGTDGTEISYKGIPCPNIGTGGHNFHSVYEYICLEDMEKTAELLIAIVEQFAKVNQNQKRILEVKNK